MRTPALVLAAVMTATLPLSASAAESGFRVVTTGLGDPYEITLGPDGFRSPERAVIGVDLDEPVRVIGPDMDLVDRRGRDTVLSLQDKVPGWRSIAAENGGVAASQPTSTHT